MATFQAIRYVRGMRNSEMFAHVEPGSPGDFDLATAGTYQGARGPKARFEDALLTTPKKIAKLFGQLVAEGFPPDMMEIVTFNIPEPTAQVAS